MKTMKAVFVFAVMLITAAASTAHGQLGAQTVARINYSDNVLTEAEIEAAETAFAEPGLLPDHPLYFLKRLGEGVRLLFAFDGASRAKLHLEFAKARLAEAKQLIKENKTEKADETLEDFGKELDIIPKGIGASASAVKESGDVLEKSGIVLALVMENAPEKAKPGLARALSNLIEKKVRIEKSDASEAEISRELQKEAETSSRIREQIRDSLEEEAEERSTEEGGKICIQVITPARNPLTGEVRDFPTPCDVPPGWEAVRASVWTEITAEDATAGLKTQIRPPTEIRAEIEEKLRLPV